MSEISIPPVKMVSTALLRTDGNNPNRMGDAEYEALKQNIIRFGFTVPLLVDDSLMVSDGEHRLRAAKELGMDSVPVIVLPVSESERLILRQVMNKLRGRHDTALDIEEYKRIFASSAEDYRVLLGISEKDLDSIRQLVDSGPLAIKGDDLNVPSMEGHLEVYLRGNIKQIVLYYSHEDFMAIVPRLQRAVAHAGLKDNTEFFTFLLGRYEEENGLDKK